MAYPYTGTDGKCTTTCTVQTITNITSVARVGKNDTALLQALYAQPVSLSVDASDAAWQFYAGGVMNAKACGKDLGECRVADSFNCELGCHETWLLVHATDVQMTPQTRACLDYNLAHSLCARCRCHPNTPRFSNGYRWFY